MKYALVPILLLICVEAVFSAPKQEYYEIRTYFLKDKSQEEKVDKYLQNALLPALHRASIADVGVFKPIESDSTFGKRIYVLIPYSSFDEFLRIPETLLKDKEYINSGKEYLDAPYDNVPYARIQKILLKAFSGLPVHQLPALKGPASERLYELRSYEGHTEKISKNKIKMFNDGDEVGLFKRLGFNAVFYGEVISGPRMPNLMYMTTFENQSSRDEHWNAFREDAQWKVLSKDEQYQHNVSKNEITFLRPTSYSGI